MKVIISDKQLLSLLESYHKQEFEEIDLIGDMERRSFKIPAVSDINPDIDFDVQKHYDDNTRKTFQKNIGTKKSFSQKILWQNELNIDDYNDIGFVELNDMNRIKIRLYDDNFDMVLAMTIERYMDGYQVVATITSDLGAGKKIAFRTYVKLSQYIKKPLYSDSTQTNGSKYGIWYKLFNVFQNKVFAVYENERYPIKMVNGEMTFSDNKKVYRDSDDDDFDETPLLVLLP
jgi:hypothetical protein